MLRSYVVALASMLAGASVVHNIYKPDLTIPGYEPSEDEGDGAEAAAAAAAANESPPGAPPEGPPPAAAATTVIPSEGS